ncbi:cysteine-rich repeat secretory protein 4-like [Rhododendron vialii]|uniref:cysteine-rich repeat secretory protein 4-like n=1 Tax=Rhododendron vialii TaxID=182163 RepID=UPI00265E8337|nr:cysteine-rich repeat secretory protein 4-like [Rhododendron vialii]
MTLFKKKTSHCIVRFSNKSFFTSMDLQPAIVVYAGNITDWIDEFDKTLDDLVDELINRAAEGNSSLKFATDEKNYTQYQYENIVYGLMQCVPGLSPGDCTSCLRAAVEIYQNGYLRRPLQPNSDQKPDAQAANTTTQRRPCVIFLTIILLPFRFFECSRFVPFTSFSSL